MNDIRAAGAFPLGDRVVKRLGYGAMQLAGPGVFGPPKDHNTAIAVLREAVASGVNHIDTSDYYGPYVTNQLIREALHPYPDDLVIVTKIGARRGPDASWIPAISPAELKSAVQDNLRNLKLDAMEVVNLRIMGDGHGPTEGSDRGPAHGPGRSSAAGPRAPHWAQQRHLRSGRRGAEHLRHRLRSEHVQCGASRGRRPDRRACPSRNRLCAVLPARRLHAVAVDGAERGRHAARRDPDAGRARLAASSARPTSCSFRAPRRSSTCAKTWPRRASSCRPTR